MHQDQRETEIGKRYRVMPLMKLIYHRLSETEQISLFCERLEG